MSCCNQSGFLVHWTVFILKFLLPADFRIDIFLFKFFIIIVFFLFVFFFLFSFFFLKKAKQNKKLSFSESLEKAMAPHSSTLAWKIPGTEKPGGLQYLDGVVKSRTRLSNFTFTFHFPALEKEMATHSSILAWRIPGTGEPGGLASVGSHRVGHDWNDLAAAAPVKVCWW